MDPTTTTLTQLAEAIASRQIGAVEATQAYLDRIASVDGDLHAYQEVHDDRALQRAMMVDAGEVTGPLAGVPIALKDNMCITHGHTTCSSKMLENFKWLRNSRPRAR